LSAFLQLQKLLPQHGLSRLLGRIAASESPLLSRTLIDIFSRIYGVRLDDAARRNPRDYRSFNDFFTRELASDARPVDGCGAELISPADGTLSQFGIIEQGQLIQAKGTPYACAELLGDDGLAALLDGGWFATVYLAPRDYHRVHLPFAGTLRRTREIPGELFSVNATTEASVQGLFCRNERLVCEFHTLAGPMAVVLVGALIVASIETVWDGPISPYQERRERRYDIPFARGAEIGRFLLGSTVIVLLPPNTFSAGSLAPDQTVRVGSVLGRLTHSPS
jgi:phosphatidylserine decarboxylase